MSFSALNLQNYEWLWKDMSLEEPWWVSFAAIATDISSLYYNPAGAALIEKALQITDGNRTRAAELLGVTDRTLRNKLARQRAATGEKS